MASPSVRRDFVLCKVVLRVSESDVFSVLTDYREQLKEVILKSLSMLISLLNP